MSTSRTSLVVLLFGCSSPPVNDTGLAPVEPLSLCPGEGGAGVSWVQVDAPAGGDGSTAAPFARLQEAVDAAGPGTRIVLVGDDHVGGAMIDKPARHQGLAVAGCGRTRVVGALYVRGTPGAALLDLSFENLSLSGPLDIAYAHGVRVTDVDSAGTYAFRALHSTVTLAGSVEAVAPGTGRGFDVVGGSMTLEGTLSASGAVAARVLGGASLHATPGSHMFLTECEYCLGVENSTVELGSVTVTDAGAFGIGLVDSVVTVSGPITIARSGKGGILVLGDAGVFHASGDVAMTDIESIAFEVGSGGLLNLDAPVALAGVGFGFHVSDATVTATAEVTIDGVYDGIVAVTGASLTLAGGAMTGVERIGIGVWGGQVELAGAWTIASTYMGAYVQEPEDAFGSGSLAIPGQLLTTGGDQGVTIHHGGQVSVSGILGATGNSEGGVVLVEEAVLDVSGELDISESGFGLYLTGTPTFLLSGTAHISSSLDTSIEALGGTIEATPTGSLLLDGAGSVGLRVDGGTALLQGALDIQDVVATCIYATNSEIEIASATMTNCERYGIVVVGGTALLSDIAIAAVGYDGIILSDLATPPTITSVSVEGAGRAAALLDGPGGSWEHGSLETSGYAIVQQGCAESEAIALVDVTFTGNVDNAPHLCDGTTLTLPE